MGEFRMPSLGADMDVGTIVDWLVKPGDPVTRGQIVAVVDTAKAAIEIEAFEAGVVEEILVGTGVQVPVGTPLARIGVGASGERPTPTVTPPQMPAPAPEPLAREPELGTSPAPAPEPLARELEQITSPAPALVSGHMHEPIATATPAGAPAPVHEPLGRASEPAATPAPGPGAEVARPATPARATPPVRHLARQLGVDLGAVVGSGPGGQVTHDDVLRAAPAAPPSASPAKRRARAAQHPVPPPPHATPPRARATPRARRIAAERGIDLGAVVGSGEAGAILGADVERAVAGTPVAAQPAPTEPTSPIAVGKATASGAPSPDEVQTAAHPDRKAAMRTAIANLMSRSNAEIPHYYVTRTIDLAPALAWLREHNAALPAERRLVPAVLFLRATALAAITVPDLNGHWIDGGLRRAPRVDLGVAVATRGGGLVTPAIPDAGAVQVDDLMARLTDLVRRARRGALKQAEMAGASITVSSLGDTGQDALYGVIFPPQVALVGIGGIVERPWAVDGMLTVRPTVTVVLAADHRASDGRTASAFLAAFAHALDHPEEM